MRTLPVLLIAAALIAACDNAPDADSPRPENLSRTATPAPDDPSRVEIYTVRGVVTMLPEPGKPASEFMVRHEPIPDFVNKEGRTVGMNAMTMAFPVASPDLLKGLAVGDKVSMVWEVRWFGDPMSAVTAIEKLPPDTELSFDPPPDTGG